LIPTSIKLTTAYKSYCKTKNAIRGLSKLTKVTKSHYP
jgi:hypothetical protein